MRKSSMLTGIGYIAMGFLFMTTALLNVLLFRSLLWVLGGASLGAGIGRIREHRNQQEYVDRESGRKMHGIVIVLNVLLLLVFYDLARMGLYLPFSMLMVLGLALLLILQILGGILIKKFLESRGS